MKVYKVNLTEGELRLFSEFLEQREFDKKEEILIGNDGIHEVNDPIMVKVQKPNNPGLRISYSGPTAKSPKFKFAWGDIGTGINGHYREIDDLHRLAVGKKSLSEGELHKISNKMAEKQRAIHKGMAIDADFYLNEYPEVKDTETGEMLNNLLARADDPNLTKSDLAEKYRESIKTIRDTNSKKRALDIVKPKNTSLHNSKTDKPLEEIKDVPIITEPEEEDKDTLALAHQVRFNEEQKKKIGDVKPSDKTYNPKTDHPLEEIKDAPIITEPEEKERTKELNKFRRDHKREEFINKVKEIPGKVKNKFDSLSEKYEETFDGRSLGKDAAIIAGTTAALGAGAYGIHRYLKNKKKNKDEAEKKYKTSDKKKK